MSRLLYWRGTRHPADVAPPHFLGLLVAVVAVTAWSGPALSQPLRVQLSWTHQAQYAGYYVAEARGFYQVEGAEVSLVEGGPGIAPGTSALARYPRQHRSGYRSDPVVG